jgi:hypothetical protein
MRSRYERLKSEVFASDGLVVMIVAIVIVAVTLPHLID